MPREHLRLAEQLVKEHPDYMFGRAALANLRTEAGRLDEARELLGPSLRLREEV